MRDSSTNALKGGGALALTNKKKLILTYQYDILEKSFWLQSNLVERIHVNTYVKQETFFLLLMFECNAKMWRPGKFWIFFNIRFICVQGYILCKILWSGGWERKEDLGKFEKGERKTEENYIKNGGKGLKNA